MFCSPSFLMVHPMTAHVTWIKQSLEVAHYGVLLFSSIKFPFQGCTLKKYEGSLVCWTCEIQGAQHAIPMRKPRFPSCLVAKVRSKGSPGATRSQSGIPVEFISSGRFQIHLFISSCIMSSEFTRETVTKFLPAQFSWIFIVILSIHNQRFFSLL